MKQTSNPWTKLFMLMLIAASAVVLFTATALAKSPSSALASDDTVHAPAVSTPPPSAIYISTSHNAKIGAGESNNPDNFRFKRNQILLCVLGGNNKCTWSLYLDLSAIGIPKANLRDFEVLSTGDVLFVIDRKEPLPNTAIVATPRDVIRYSAAGVFSLELLGSDIGLTKSNENIDALAITPDGHLVISTFGQATINGIVDSNGKQAKVHDSDLVKITGNQGSLYFDGHAVKLTKSSEDVAAAWIGNPSPDHNIYLVTKGNFDVTSVNSLTGRKSDIFGCSPTSQNPIDSCFFYSFFEGETSGLDNQIDGISVLSTGPIANAAISAATQEVSNSVVDADEDDSYDAAEYADAMSQGDPEITAEDFVDISAHTVYLPMVRQ